MILRPDNPGGRFTVSRGGAAFVDFYRAVKDDIFAWCRALRFEPTEQQRLILHDVEQSALYGKPTHIAIKSGHGIGKTAVQGVIGSWLLLRCADSKGVLTAPTLRQCKTWIGELRSLLKKAPKDVARFFEVQATKVICLGQEGWDIQAVTGTRDVNLQGFHNPNLFIIGDEASGIARDVMVAMIATMTNENKTMLLCGNPNTRDSYFFDAFNRLRRHWSTHTMNAEDSPLVDKRNHRLIEETYGRDSDVYRVRVLGEFPLQDPRCVMSTDDLEKCVDVPLYEALRAGTGKQIGIDFARFGDDASTIYLRSGLAVVKHRIFHKTEPLDVVGCAWRMQREAMWDDDECLYVADAGGLGGGLMGNFYRARKRLFEFNFGGRPARSSEFADMATEAFFDMAALVKAHRVKIPNDSDLIAELGNRQYYYNLKGLIQLESKDGYKERVQTGSPDRADGCVMAFYDRAAVKAVVSRRDAETGSARAPDSAAALMSRRILR